MNGYYTGRQAEYGNGQNREEAAEPRHGAHPEPFPRRHQGPMYGHYPHEAPGFQGHGGIRTIGPAEEYYPVDRHQAPLGEAPRDTRYPPTQTSNAVPNSPGPAPEVGRRLSLMDLANAALSLERDEARRGGSSYYGVATDPPGSYHDDGYPGGSYRYYRHRFHADTPRHMPTETGQALPSFRQVFGDPFGDAEMSRPRPAPPRIPASVTYPPVQERHPLPSTPRPRRIWTPPEAPSHNPTPFSGLLSDSPEAVGARARESPRAVLPLDYAPTPEEVPTQVYTPRAEAEELPEPSATPKQAAKSREKEDKRKAPSKNRDKAFTPATNDVHSEWQTVRVGTAVCDGCEKKGHAVLQRCRACVTHVCEACWRAGNFDSKHVMDGAELDWTTKEEHLRQLLESSGMKRAAAKSQPKRKGGSAAAGADGGRKSARVLKGRVERRRSGSGGGSAASRGATRREAAAPSRAEEPTPAAGVKKEDGVEDKGEDTDETQDCIVVAVSPSSVDSPVDSLVDSSVESPVGEFLSRQDEDSTEQC